MRDSDFSSIDDYMSEPTAEDYNDSTTSTSASFGMGSEDDFATGNANDFTIGRDPSNITNFIGPLSGNNNVPNVFDLGGGVGDFGFGNTRSQNFLNPQLAEMYKQQEIARTGVNLDKNPFVDSIFTKMFGDSIDRRRDLGSQRIQEINDLRARQAFGLPSLNTGLSYTSKDFEEGRDTNQGMVRELPMGGIERFARTFTPYGAMLPTRAAPEQSQMYRDAQAEANAPGIMSMTGDFLTDIANSAERVFSGIFSGKPVAEPFDEVNPNYSAPRVNDFNQFTPSSSRTYEATDRDFTPITNVSISKENVVNPYEDNLGMTLKGDSFRDSRGLPLSDSRMSTDVNKMLEAEDFKKELMNLKEDERKFLSGRTDTISAGNEDELMADASSYIPQSFIDAGEGLGQLFNEDGVPIGPGNLRFQYDPDQEESQFKYTIPFTA
jgi:hypothetical protein